MLPSIKIEYVSYEELYEAYLCCRKHKRKTSNASEFEVNLTENLYKLWIDLNQKKYKIGRSIAFIVDKPVKREVFAADFRDRIVHHLIVNRIMEAFESSMIDNSFSCRVGKGTLKAVKTLEKDIYEASEGYTKDVYVLKCDLKSFFMTISKKLLYEKIERLIREKVYPDNDIQSEYLCWLCELIIMNNPQDNCVLRQSWKKWIGFPKEKSMFFIDALFGVPIGNLTSQIFANFFLSDFDFFVLDELGVKYYGRYVDDFYIIGESPEELMALVPKITENLLEIGVTLHPKKLYIQNIRKGVKFVGSVVKPNRLYISNRTVGNLSDAIMKFKKYFDEIGEELITNDDILYYSSVMNSYLGFMRHHNSYNIRKKYILSENNLDFMKFCYTNGSLTKVLPFREYSGKRKGLTLRKVETTPVKTGVIFSRLPFISVDRQRKKPDKMQKSCTILFKQAIYM